jgi:hypothetical protein
MVVGHSQSQQFNTCRSGWRERRESAQHSELDSQVLNTLDSFSDCGVCAVPNFGPSLRPQVGEGGGRLTLIRGQAGGGACRPGITYIYIYNVYIIYHICIYRHACVLTLLVVILLVYSPGDKDRLVKCMFCRKFNHVRKWKCTCGICWHSCRVHGNQYCTVNSRPPQNPAKAGQPGKPQSGVGVKRKGVGGHLVGFDAILEDDIRKAKALRWGDKVRKRARDIDLGVQPRVFKRPTLLGPILRNRFHGGSSSCS